jgi:hypothetical protein
MFDERIGFGLTRGLYAALDFELGDFDAAHSAEGDIVFDGLASLGARGGFGPFAFAAELAAGAMESSYPTDRDAHVQALVEARGHAELWLAPTFSVGGMIGTSLIDHGAWLAGAYIAFHSWGYAGDRWTTTGY